MDLVVSYVKGLRGGGLLAAPSSAEELPLPVFCLSVAESQLGFGPGSKTDRQN